jgi:hypothetical protein
MPYMFGIHCYSIYSQYQTSTKSTLLTSTPYSREKDRVFEEVRTKKKKISGSDIINVTQLYTEKYMVRFLVENSLGAMWMEMYPDSQLCNKWEYFVKDPNNSRREPKPVKEITFLDPAGGSRHFQLYAFDLFYDI